MKELYTYKILRQGEGVQGLEVSLDLEFAKRARELEINPKQKKGLVQRAIGAISPDYKGSVNLETARILLFHRTVFSNPGSWMGLFEECRYPFSSNYGEAFSLQVVRRDWQEIEKPYFRGPVRYRSINTNSNNEDKLDRLLRLFEQGWLRGVQELLTKQ